MIKDSPPLKGGVDSGLKKPEDEVVVLSINPSEFNSKNELNPPSLKKGKEFVTKML